ncbi:hypothetical protein [Qiania dongpingensis]|uniref:Uncharacterized protein n=1 Tax=Qiania dongpingensis TaxID=2763669 RepID=A0A7G9G3F8_9FIRM|nr:hypothetical protein [Qiania dongpingensis]QNM05340.1 hypothetical protein H9Q78_13020 [Qiania dongpingensis]
MKRSWVRRDFSADSPIRETLLLKLLKQSSAVREIPDQYDEWIAAAGIPEEERSAMDKGLFRKKE